MKKDKTIVENIISSPLNDLISDRYGDYAKYIIQERALPDVRDGLKPVQRRILYAMYKDGNTSDKPYRKSAKTVGLVIGNYHPHGDSSVYEAMVRLSQSWKINCPLIQMHGNNGSIDDDPAAAMRYTEARLASISEELLADIDKNTINWVANFDDTENEPTVLPARFPNLLINGSTGIAAGYATNIPPHNISEVIDGTIFRIKNPDCSLDELMNYIKGPDFPTGGIIQGLSQIKEAFSTGKGKIVVRSKTAIEKDKNGTSHIIISEIPYEVVKSNLVKKIDDIRFSKSIDGILDVKDVSDRNGLKIIVDVSKDVDANNVLNYLFKNTDLQIYYNYNMVAIVNNRPTYLSLISAIDGYVDFYKDFVLKRTKFEFDKRVDRCHILEGLIKAVSVLDEVISIIRSSKDKADAKTNLINRFDFTEMQAEAIVVLRLYRLTNTDVFELKNEYRQLVEQLKQLKEILENNDKLCQVLIDELTTIKEKYGKERLSVIQNEISEIQIDKTSMISNERVVVTLSRDGYIKKVSLRSYNSSDNTVTGLKANDQLIGYLECDSLDNLIAFDEDGQYICLPVYQLADSKWKDIGQHISNYVKVANSVKYLSCYIVKDFNTYSFFITLTKNGMIKKTLVQDYQLQRTSKSSYAINLQDDDKVIDCKLAYENDEVIIVTENGYNLRYPISQIPLVKVKAKGVRAVKLTEQDKAASLTIANNSLTEVVYFTDKGNSKRIKLADIALTNRASKGLLICKRVKSNPSKLSMVIACKLNDDLSIIVDDKNYPLLAKDIALLNTTQRFSINGLPDGFYHYPSIQEVKIVDFPIEKVDFDQMSLEV